MQLAQVSYVGFKNLAASREYTLRVTQVDGTSNDFVFAVANSNLAYNSELIRD